MLVLERETEAGGIPRHSEHLGYGLRDRHRFGSGPNYARTLAARAAAAGAQIRTAAMVTGWTTDGSLEVTAPTGRSTVSAPAVLLATGARERPRAARLIPGDRGGGIYTTGQLQNLVHLQHRSPGTRAVVVGAELVSWSAVLTLRAAGCRVELMVTGQPRPESYALLNLVGRAALRVPVATRTRVSRIIGTPRTTGVELLDRHGRRRIVECDTIVFTGDWIPDNELARAAALDLDPGSLAPVTSSTARTSRAGVFAAGNLVHPVVTADLAALAGRRAAADIEGWLRSPRPQPEFELSAAEPFRWISPGRWHPGSAEQRLVLWSDEFVRTPTVLARQDGRVVGRVRTPWPAAPGRAFLVPARLVATVDPARGPVLVGLG